MLPLGLIGFLGNISYDSTLLCRQKFMVNGGMEGLVSRTNSAPTSFFSLLTNTVSVFYNIHCTSDYNFTQTNCGYYKSEAKTVCAVPAKKYNIVQ